MGSMRPQESADWGGSPSGPDTLRALRAHGYEGPRPDVAAVVPTTARNILELGCSTGALGAAIKRRQETHIVGVEVDAGYAVEAKGRLDRVAVMRAEDFVAEAQPEAPFDCIIAADVLEHLVDPWTTVENATEFLAPGGTVVVSVPNVFYWKALRRILTRARWPREDQGIFDGTHLRWFGRTDAHELLSGAGLTVTAEVPQFWVEGWRLKVAQLLYRMPLAPYLAPQYILVGKQPFDDVGGQSSRSGPGR